MKTTLCLGFSKYYISTRVIINASAQLSAANCSCVFPQLNIPVFCAKELGKEGTATAKDATTTKCLAGSHCRINAEFTYPKFTLDSSHKWRVITSGNLPMTGRALLCFATQKPYGGIVMI